MPLDVALAPLPPLPELATLWTQLEQRSAPTFFKSWTWIGNWLTAAVLPALAPGYVHLVRVSEDGNLLGLGIVCEAPLRRVWKTAVPGFCLSETGRPEIDTLTVEYNGFLCARGHEQKVAGVALAALCRRWPVGRINRIGVADFESACGPAAHWRLRRTERCALIAADAPLNLDGYLDQLSPNTRRQIRRSMKLFGALRVSVATPHDVESTFTELSRLHAIAWAGRRSNAFGNPLFDRFARGLITAGTGKGVVELIRVATEQATLGILMNFRAGDDMYAYQSGFQMFGDNRLKPGLVCHALAAVDAMGRGVRAYHFMAGDGQYKTSLGNAEEVLYSIEVGRPGVVWELESALLAMRSRAARWLHHR